jgi:hypothetical protein
MSTFLTILSLWFFLSIPVGIGLGKWLSLATRAFGPTAPTDRLHQGECC